MVDGDGPRLGLAQRTVWQFAALNELGVAEEDPELLRAPGRRFFDFFLHDFAFGFSVVLRNHHFLRLFFLKGMTVCEWLLEPTNLRRPPYRICEILFEFWDSGTTWWHGLLLKGLWYKYGGIKVENLIDFVLFFSLFSSSKSTVMPCRGYSFCWNLGHFCRGYCGPVSHLKIDLKSFRKRCSAGMPFTLCSVASANCGPIDHALWWQISKWEVLKVFNYGWWKKSCTTWDVWNPANNGIFTISTGAGFLPSTVSKERGDIFGYLFFLQVPPLFAPCLNFAPWKGFICINVTHILFSSHNI